MKNKTYNKIKEKKKHKMRNREIIAITILIIMVIGTTTHIFSKEQECDKLQGKNAFAIYNNKIEPGYIQCCNTEKEN